VAAVLDRVRYYVPYAWRFAVLRHSDPLVCGIAITDRCNLACRGCRVSNTGRPDMTWEQVVGVMRSTYARGYRELYLSGGEPMLWRDAERTLEDVIAEGRRIGFFHVHVYTNGTLGLSTSADLAWVSIDGLPGTYEKRRGDHFDEVDRAVRERPGGQPKVSVIYVIDRGTASGIGPFLRWVRDTKFPVLGVMVYFHTPYYGRDELYLDADERARIIDELLELKREGLPLINSRAGLLALKSGDWPRRTHTALVVDVDGESDCCRAADEVCVDCGYAACTEITEAQKLRPSAVLGMVRYL
jgi:MoaA/NifB/PqqE/SkfB family radical SAM enzyme